MCTLDSSVINDFSKFHELLSASKILFVKDGLKDVVQNYLYLLISENHDYDEQKTQIERNIQNSKLMIIDQNKDLNEKTNKQYLLISFEKTVLIAEQHLTASFINNIISKYSGLPICFLSDSKSLIKDKITKNYRDIQADSVFIKEIETFSYFLANVNVTGSIKLILKIISPCISAYLIKKSYLAQNKPRIQKFKSESESKSEPTAINISEKEYIELRNIGIGSSFICELIYHIKHEKLYAIKKPNAKEWDVKQLAQRELSNYLKVSHPFLPKYYGLVKNKNYIVIEFINGNTLSKMKKKEFYP